MAFSRERFWFVRGRMDGLKGNPITNFDCPATVVNWTEEHIEVARSNYQRGLASGLADAAEYADLVFMAQEAESLGCSATTNDPTAAWNLLRDVQAQMTAMERLGAEAVN